MKIQIPPFDKIALTDSLSLIPYEWEGRKETDAQTNVIHHKNKATIESYQFLLNAFDKNVKSIFEIRVKNGGSLCLWDLMVILLLRVNASDINQLDHFIPVWIEIKGQPGCYFYRSELKQFKVGSAESIEVELGKLP